MSAALIGAGALQLKRRPIVAGVLFTGFFRGRGDTKTPLVGTVIANLVNGGLAYGLVYGRFGLPNLGIAGAGLATATANWTAPAANAGPAITAYQVVAEQVNAAGTVLATTTSANQPATARKLSMTLPLAGNYRFSVRAINIVGNSALSARSNTVAGR